MSIYVIEISIFFIILGKRDDIGHNTKILRGQNLVENPKYS